MKFILGRQKVFLGGLVLVLGILFVLVYQSRTGEKAEAGTLAADVAVARALTSATYYYGIYGGIRAKPTGIYGKLMTHKESIELITARPIEPNALAVDRAGKLVWLIFIHGDIVEIVPAGAGGNPPEKHIKHGDGLAVVVDAYTGEIMQKSLLTPGQEFDVRTLSELPYPDELSFEVFPTQPIQTKEPLPTETASAN